PVVSAAAATGVASGAAGLATGVSSQFNIIKFPYSVYWQASHSSKPSSPGIMVQTAPTISACGRLAPAMAASAEGSLPLATAFNSPPRPVDFSALVAPLERR